MCVRECVCVYGMEEGEPSYHYGMRLSMHWVSVKWTKGKERTGENNGKGKNITGRINFMVIQGKISRNSTLYQRTVFHLRSPTRQPKSTLNPFSISFLTNKTSKV